MYYCLTNFICCSQYVENSRGEFGRGANEVIGIGPFTLGGKYIVKYIYVVDNYNN